VADLNPASLEVLRGCKVEAALANASPGAGYQFERQGYFCADLDSTPEAPVFNRTVTLKDAWARMQARG
jgi:glutaminyl-tRNA synthetase